MRIFRRLPLLLIPLLAGLVLRPSAYAGAILTVDGKGCPAISDHQRFVQEIMKGNVDYDYPASCIDLPRGTQVSDPIEEKQDRFGSETTGFILVDVAGKGRYWTLASWVESVPSDITGSLGPSPTSLQHCQVWFAKELRSRFGDAIPFHGSEIAFDRIACLPTDITSFTFSARQSVITFSVAGSLKLSALPAPFKAIDADREAGYTLLLQAYLFSPDGRLVWSQEGVPEGDARVSARGGSVRFKLIDTYMGSLSGHQLLVVAAGDPILSAAAETRVILGAKIQRFP